MAWLLACTTFSEDDAIKNWVADELQHPDRKGLLLHNLALIPESWRADPAFARKAAVTIREEASKPFRNGAIALAESLPDDEALDALLPALDSWRPVRAGSALLKRFGSVPRCARCSTIAFMGSSWQHRSHHWRWRRSAPQKDSGCSSNHRDPRPTRVRGEARVVVAMALADAWAKFASTPEHLESAAILSEYDPDELATSCAAVGTAHLTWHVDAIIAAWPAHEAVVAFALQALQHPRHISSGIHDPAPPAIVRAYGARADATANMMMDAVLDQLVYLPPQLREVLVDALTRSDLTPATLRDLLEDWNQDPDVWVQRTARPGWSVGSSGTGYHRAPSIRRPKRSPFGFAHRCKPNSARTVRLWKTVGRPAGSPCCCSGTLSCTMGSWKPSGNTSARCATPTPFLGVDRELVDLLNSNWDEVYSHFGDDLFVLLSASNARDVREDTRASVLGQLSTSSSLHPSVIELILAEADANPNFRNSAEYLLWSHRGGRRDLDLFVACLTNVEASVTSSRREVNGVYDLLVHPDSWQIPADTLRDALMQQPGSDTDPLLGALFCELFPTDVRSRTMFLDLEGWFRAAMPRGGREWIDSLAVAVRSSPPSVLPTIVDRAHHQIMLWDAADLFPLRHTAGADSATIRTRSPRFGPRSRILPPRTPAPRSGRTRPRPGRPAYRRSTRNGPTCWQRFSTTPDFSTRAPRR